MKKKNQVAPKWMYDYQIVLCKSALISAQTTVDGSTKPDVFFFVVFFKQYESGSLLESTAHGESA